MATQSETDSETEPNTLTSPPDGRRRVAVSIAIAAVLLFQLIVPLRYYLSGDPFDERFAWRMFSAVRVTRCGAMALERDTDAVPLSPIRISGARDRAGQPHYGVIHNAWRTLIQRNRVAVIDAYLAHRCNVAEIAEASVENRCVDAAGQRLPALRWHRRCANGESSAPTPADLTAVRTANAKEAP